MINLMSMKGAISLVDTMNMIFTYQIQYWDSFISFSFFNYFILDIPSFFPVSMLFTVSPSYTLLILQPLSFHSFNYVSTTSLSPRTYLH